MNCRDDSIEQPLRGWFYYIKLIRELTRFHAFLLGVPLILSLKKDTDFFSDWYKKYHKNPKFQRAVYDYLMDTDVADDFNFDKQRPMTDAHRDIQRRSMNREMKFILHYITEAWDAQHGSHQQPLAGGRFFKLTTIHEISRFFAWGTFETYEFVVFWFAASRFWYIVNL